MRESIMILHARTGRKCYHAAMRIIVTGGAGFIGSNLVWQLCENEGVNVLARYDSIRLDTRFTFFGR